MRIALLAMTLFCTVGLGQKPATTLPPDPFLAAIETMKRSVTALACLSDNGKDAQILARNGTAFFISEKGDFLTAAHVIQDMQKRQASCPVAVVMIPTQKWQPDARAETLVWWPFSVSSCRIDRDMDLVACSTENDLSILRSGLEFKIAPVKLDSRIPPDGTQVAFTGFPLDFRDPLTIRASVAAYRTIWRGDMTIGDILLDRASWVGSSGSPVYLPDGTVIGVVIGTAKDGSEVMVARAALFISENLRTRPK
jgi:V8-like Glu-specific endopeptidase